MSVLIRSISGYNSTNATTSSVTWGTTPTYSQILFVLSNVTVTSVTGWTLLSSQTGSCNLYCYQPPVSGSLATITANLATSGCALLIAYEFYDYNGQLDAIPTLFSSQNGQGTSNVINIPTANMPANGSVAFVVSASATNIGTIQNWTNSSYDFQIQDDILALGQTSTLRMSIGYLDIPTTVLTTIPATVASFASTGTSNDIGAIALISYPSGGRTSLPVPYLDNRAANSFWIQYGNYAASAISTTHTVNLPSTATSGNTLILIATFDTVITIPSGWTRDVTLVANCETSIYRKTSNGTETGATVTISPSDAGCLAIFEFQGTLTPDGSATASTGYTNNRISTGTTLTTTGSSDLVIAMIGVDEYFIGSNPINPIVAWTNDFYTNVDINSTANTSGATRNTNMAIAMKRATSTGTFTTSAITSCINAGSNTNNGMIIAYK